jgi:NADP-dependent 3-hydroxy acid dehydrogenase YdfG
MWAIEKSGVGAEIQLSSSMLGRDFERTWAHVSAFLAPRAPGAPDVLYASMKTAVITGAGSGVGRALTIRLVSAGWRVAVVGRRREALEETARMTGGPAANVRVYAGDVGDPSAVAAMAADVIGEWSDVDVLVNGAGPNAPRRLFHELSLDDYHGMIATNLNGAYYCVKAFLPGMRARGTGTIVNIVSDAGKLASTKAGPAYVMSKFGMAGLNQSINAEARADGVRACAIFPGDINTPILDRRPAPPDAQARSRMLQADDVADCAMFCINAPAHVVVEEMVVRPR